MYSRRRSQPRADAPGARWLKGRGIRNAHALAAEVLAATKAQRRELPAAKVKAALVAEIASEVLKTKERIAALDARLEELLAASPQGRVLRSLPGMGTVLSAEFLAETGDVGRFASADRLAAAAGIAPVLRASGKVSYRRRPKQGNRVLKRLFYQSAFSARSRATKGARPSTDASDPRARGTTRRSSPWPGGGLTCSGRCCVTSRPTKTEHPALPKKGLTTVSGYTTSP